MATTAPVHEPYPTEIRQKYFSEYTPDTPAQLLREYKCSSPLFPHLIGGVICVSHNDTANIGMQVSIPNPQMLTFKVLTNNRILAAPILDDERRPVGTFSMRAVIGYMTRYWTEADFKRPDIDQVIFNQLANKRIGDIGTAYSLVF